MLVQHLHATEMDLASHTLNEQSYVHMLEDMAEYVPTDAQEQAAHAAFQQRIMGLLAETRQRLFEVRIIHKHKRAQLPHADLTHAAIARVRAKNGVAIPDVSPKEK